MLLQNWYKGPVATTGEATVRCLSRFGTSVCLLPLGHKLPHTAEGFNWMGNEPVIPAPVVDNFNSRQEWAAVHLYESDWGVITPERFVLARVYGNSRETNGERTTEHFDAKANAELMAAAPRLLHKLQEFDHFREAFLAKEYAPGSTTVHRLFNDTRQLVDELKEKLK